MICAVGVNLGLEPRPRFRVLHVVPLPAAHERRNVGVVRALQRKVAYVLNPAVLLGGFVLAIRRRNRHHRLDRESIIELDIRVVGIVFHSIKRRRRRRGFSPSRMSHQRDPRQVDFALKRNARRLVPLLPQFQVLEQQPAPHRAARFQRRIVKQASVHEILVNRDKNESAAR